MVQRTAQGFVAEQEGQLVGVAFACHQGDYSSIGLVIVKDEHQGRGVGRQLMNLCVDTCAPRTPILNATEAGAPLYTSMGFVTFDHIQQHQGVPKRPIPCNQESGHACRTLTPADQADLLALANAGSGLDRAAVMIDLLTVAEHTIGIEVDGKLEGIAMLRPFGRGRVIGPVVAKDLPQAQALISHLLALIPESFVRIDIPASCGLADWLQNMGMLCVDRAPRMVKGHPPRPTAGTRQFALVTQAIG